MSTTSPTTPAKIASSLSPAPSQSIRTTSITRDALVRSPGSSPKAQRRRSDLKEKHHNASAKIDSPSPSAHNTRESPTRRESFKQPASYLPTQKGTGSLSRDPQRRLSSVHFQNGKMEDDPKHNTRARADSLAPVPDHLERSDTSESLGRPLERFKTALEDPPFIARVQMSPTQPTPNRYAFEGTIDHKISAAVDDLENMVRYATDLAEHTEDHEHIKEIHGILEDAKSAIDDVTVNETTHLMATVSPLKVDTSDACSSDSSADSKRGLRKQSVPSQSLKKVAPLPITRKNTAKSYIVLPRKSAAHDFAYTSRFDENFSINSSSSSDEIDVEHNIAPKAGNLFVPQPHPVQSTSRDHVDFVLRPQAQQAIKEPTIKHFAKVNTPRKRSDRIKSGHRRNKSPYSSQIDRSVDGVEHVVYPHGGDLHISDQAHYHTINLHRRHRRQPIARNWSNGKKRLTAVIACMNTALLGILIGVYAGEVPRIQYFLADERHVVIIGNVLLYFGLAVSTFVTWPLPLLHGRKPYVLSSLALALPLQFPQALVVSTERSPDNAIFRTGLLSARAVLGLVLGFANVNHITVLLDLFGASLQSKNPHQEFVVASDVRRHGGGMGIWLGIWSWCWIGSLAVGFQIGAAVIENLNPDWGFYIVIIILAAALILNIVAPETRRAPYRRSVTEVYDRDENYITRRVSRGEVKLHISTEGPKYWFEEVYAGMKLMFMMVLQPGFLVLSLYLGWIYAQIVLVIVLLGALLSRDYRWRPRKVGAGVMAITIGALLAIPLTKAGIFSRERKQGFRTDSMTFQKQVTWSSHLVRRCIFTLTLPLMGLAYTLSSNGAPKLHMVPIVFAGAVGFLSILAIAECHGIIMETFDTSDLQPGVNTKHRLQSMAVQDRRRRTNYTSFPRVSAGIFASQTFAFVLAGVATMVGGRMTRHLGAQASTGVTAGILLCLTVFLTTVLWRWKNVQIIPDYTFGTRRDTAAWENFGHMENMGRGRDWKPVVISNPSGKVRRMSVLELGGLSRWTEIRRLNFLVDKEGFDIGKFGSENVEKR